MPAKEAPAASSPTADERTASGPFMWATARRADYFFCPPKSTVGGALIAEIIFSYPGLGTTLMSGIMGQDYPLISAVSLIITVMVLLATFAMELLYGFIDPRIKAAQSD